MFQIKICGITNADDARRVAAAGADAVGLNFYPKSPRFAALDAAKMVVAALPPGVVKVGLFVNAQVDQINRHADALQLDLVQLHGDEPPELLAQLGGRPVMRALRLGPQGLGPIVDYLARCRSLGCLPKFLLLDACVAGAYGGTGATADWTTAASYGTEEWHPPLVLAGGLTPENVAAAIHMVRPAAVDTASGVESAPGVKDPLLVAQFVAAARGAFAERT